MSTKAKKPTVLTLHQLLPALSYWGAATRLFLIGFLAFVVFLIRTSELESGGMVIGSALSTAGQSFLYVIGSFLILEVGYIMVARAYPLRQKADQAVLLSSEIVLAVSYFLPYFALVSAWFVNVSRLLFVAVLFVLVLRVLIGLLYGKRRA